jgi:hypothetical protein
VADENAEKLERSAEKRLRVNSIENPDTRRIRKPCEARAGHGVIALLIGLGFLSGLAYLAIRLFKALTD